MKRRNFKIDDSIQVLVDDQLQDHGSFNPVDFLLTSGRFSYSAYEAWRYRKKEYLDELLSGSVPEIISQLQQACDYAEHLGLDRVHAQVMSWSRPDTTETQALRCSRNSELEALLSIQFEAKTNHPQHDLFVNNPVTVLINNLVVSIIGRNSIAAEGHLKDLYIKAPDHKDLQGFELLVHSLEMMKQPAKGQMSELQVIEEHFVDAAQKLLGNKWRDYINSIWHWLATATFRRSYDPKQPRLHGSYLLAQAGDWSSVQQIIEAEGNYLAVPEIGFRLAQALHFLNERSRQIEVWCRMCWAYPIETEDYLSSEKTRDSLIKPLWLSYLDIEDTFELSEAPECSLFPAWVLIQEPGLIHVLPQDMLQGDQEHQVIFELAHNLIMARMNDEPEIKHRKALAKRQATLLKYYLHRIDTG